MRQLIGLVILMCLLHNDVHCQNLVHSYEWTVGSGNVGMFDQNGTPSQNVREIGQSPYGTQEILWKAVPDAANNSDGGWDTDNFPIDRTKMYRFSVWIKKTNSNDGSTYFGCRSNDILTLAGAVNSNPYFFNGDLPELDKWFLLVGYVHASDDPSTSNYGGIYDGVTGAKVSSITDFKFSSTSTTANHRTYLYYDTNTADRQYFYGPEVYECLNKQPVSENLGSSLVSGDAFFGKRLGIGTTNPSGNFHLHGNTPEFFLTTDDWAAIRGNDGTWLFGYQGPAGNEDLSFGARDGSGSRTLTFAAGGTTRMKILGNGKVGIGTLTPTSGRLEVTQSSDAVDQGIAVLNSTGVSGLRLWTDPNSAYVFSGETGQRNLILNDAGNVGIGTASPNQKLTVNGTIYGKEVKVNLSVPGPDYVFESSYHLPSLSELETYISKHKHLPEVPTAGEMEADGILIGEMNMILLKKVEEITLYLIALKKENDSSKEEIERLKNEIKSLKNSHEN